MSHRKTVPVIDWKSQLTSEEAAELDGISVRIVEIDAERQQLTDRRRRIYDRARKRERMPDEVRAA